MDISSISGVTGYSSAMASNKVANEVDTIMLNKSMQMQEQMASEILQSVAPVSDSAQTSSALPSHLGQFVNETA